ncbi:hypothetical protein CC80DRAFT_25719 [Byssothecium circinans]|uniref:Uncharacterized protein n=1 Tax=Byssothecium circinans TaxID=147558 RepID=A0A6A5U593_9PLEO|nr:hypothetical protein CC80DRAFT_25719 [Byssothecium circinans]
MRHVFRVAGGWARVAGAGISSPCITLHLPTGSSTDIQWPRRYFPPPVSLLTALIHAFTKARSLANTTFPSQSSSGCVWVAPWFIDGNNTGGPSVLMHCTSHPFRRLA